MAMNYFFKVGSTMIIGTIIGSIAGLLGGWVDEVLMRIVDVFLSIPELIFALAIMLRTYVVLN